MTKNLGFTRLYLMAMALLVIAYSIKADDNKKFAVASDDFDTFRQETRTSINSIKDRLDGIESQLKALAKTCENCKCKCATVSAANPASEVVQTAGPTQIQAGGSATTVLSSPPLPYEGISFVDYSPPVVSATPYVPLSSSAPVSASGCTKASASSGCTKAAVSASGCTKSAQQVSYQPMQVSYQSAPVSYQPAQVSYQPAQVSYQQESVSYQPMMMAGSVSNCPGGVCGPNGCPGGNCGVSMMPVSNVRQTRSQRRGR